MQHGAPPIMRRFKSAPNLCVIVCIYDICACAHIYDICMYMPGCRLYWQAENDLTEVPPLSLEHMPLGE